MHSPEMPTDTDPLISSRDLNDSRQTEPDEPAALPERETRRVLLRLYISHFLSTWNSRMFEFGAVLFLASIFPGTLLYTSVYALARSLSAAVFSSWLGPVIDRANRLTAIRHSIIWQRVPVAVSCACFITLLTIDKKWCTPILFTMASLLACVEKLAAVANTVAVERDWAIVISESLGVPRQDLNASMRRIDLFCKLVAPLFISLLDSASAIIAIWTVLGLNALSALIEYFAIVHVYRSVPELSRDQLLLSTEDGDEEPTRSNRGRIRLIASYITGVLSPWQEYAASPVFLPSFALSLLYLTVLSFGATMVTYLLNSGFTALEISTMRIGAVIAELSGTWAAPFIMDRIGPVRSGLWFLNWQFACLAGAAAGFVFLDPASQLVAIGLICGVALSRIGLWGFDLSVQFLIQESVDERSRARFSTTEIALQSIFELLSFATTIIFPLPEQFKYPVLISYGAISFAAISFAAYVRKERGHLLHTSRCLGGDKPRPVGLPSR